MQTCLVLAKERVFPLYWFVIPDLLPGGKGTYQPMYKILIVEDDLVIAQQLGAFLDGWGYHTRSAEDFTDITGAFADFQPHLVLLDVGLPFYNGYHWCTAIRRISKVPVVFLSSAADNMNIVMAMNLGADDFIAKPFDPHVVAAKIAAILRRAYSFQGQAPLLEHRGAVLDLGSGVLTFGDARLELTRNELRILQLLLEHKGAVVSRQDIMLRLWDSDCFVDDNTLTVNVTRLRRRLEEAGLPGFITTKKGAGYFIGEA